MANIFAEFTDKSFLQSDRRSADLSSVMPPRFAFKDPNLARRPIKHSMERPMPLPTPDHHRHLITKEAQEGFSRGAKMKYLPSIFSPPAPAASTTAPAASTAPVASTSQTAPADSTAPAASTAPVASTSTKKPAKKPSKKKTRAKRSTKKKAPKAKAANPEPATEEQVEVAPAVEKSAPKLRLKFDGAVVLECDLPANDPAVNKATAPATVGSHQDVDAQSNRDFETASAGPSRNANTPKRSNKRKRKHASASGKEGASASTA